MNTASPVLSLAGYGVCFGRRVVLASVNLTLPATGVDVLMGPVKGGKSTLMRSLVGLNEAASLYRQWGQVDWGSGADGKAGQLALVQQHAASLNAKLSDALVMHSRQRGGRTSKAWAEAALTALSEHGLSHLIPLLDQPVLALPIEWQRAVNILAYALAQPSLLMVDEPTYGLEEQAAMRLIDWLCELGQTQRLMVCLHHQGQARRLAQRVILLAGGRVLAHDPVDTFFNRPANPWVEQFVRTGSLFIASPDARPEDLSADAEPPPPLSPAAQAALAEFDVAQAPAAQPARAPTVAEQSSEPSAAPEPPCTAPSLTLADDDDGAKPEPTWLPTAPQELINFEPTQPMALVSEMPATQKAVSPDEPAVLRRVLDQLPVRRTGTVLPPLSSHGVEDAAQVGRAPVTGRRGPPGFNWIIANKLAGCPEPGVMSAIDYDMDLLRAAGITYLITLTERDLPADALQRHGLKNLHLPIYDREAPSIRQVYMLVRRMQALLDEQQVIAVHCKAGIGRTGTVLAAWLIREGGLSADVAIQRLRNIMPTYVQSEMQEQFLHAFEKDILERQ